MIFKKQPVSMKSFMASPFRKDRGAGEMTDNLEYPVAQILELLEKNKNKKMNISVKDFMRPDPAVLQEESTLQDAVNIILECKADSILIVDANNRLVGLMTKTRALRELNRNTDISTKVKELMKVNPLVTGPNDDISELMSMHNIGSIPVVEQGRIVGIITLSDTARAYFGSVLKQQDDLRTVIDSIHSGLLTVNSGSYVQIVNKSAEGILNISSADVLGRKITEIFPDKHLQEAINGGKRLFGRRLRFQDKVLFMNVSPLRYKDTVNGAVIVFQDMSDFESISHELMYTKKLKDELDTIFESSFDGIYLTDKHGQILRVNEAFSRITGIEKTQILNKTKDELTKSGVMEKFPFLPTVLKGKPVTISQTIKGGKTILITSSLITDSIGNISQVVHNVRDMTELNNLRNQLEVELKLKQHYMDQLHKMKPTSKYIVKSKASRELIDLVLRVSKVDATVLIQGESGVGKEVIAEILHENSLRSGNPMTSINCAAIPENLLESELFGYEAGAFTGASRKGKIGLFELANKGTLFLDEIGELPLSLQSKFLRVLQKQEITKLGGTRPRKVDVRIIAATNRDLLEMTANHKFRKDLYYRLNVIPVIIPPLRMRKEEIPDLAIHFVEMFNKKYGLDKRFHERAIHELVHYDWPGNVRELENVIERTMLTDPDNLIKSVVLPSSHSGPSDEKKLDVDYSTDLNSTVEKVEKEIIHSALVKFGSTRKAARELGISQPTLIRKATKYKINKKGIEDDVTQF
jgi:PAS domain S-box-containing protein